MRQLLEPLLSPSYDKVAVRKALENLIQEIEYAVSQLNTNFTRVIFVSSPGYKYWPIALQVVHAMQSFLCKKNWFFLIAGADIKADSKFY